MTATIPGDYSFAHANTVDSQPRRKVLHTGDRKEGKPSMLKSLRLAAVSKAVVALPSVAIVLAAMPAAHADNRRLNYSVVSNVYTIQHQAGCTNDVRVSPQLQLAAERHTRDVLNNRDLHGDIGSDGSTAQQRANAAGFTGQVAETVAIEPAVAITNLEVLNRWYHDPASFAIMSNCANSQIGVWSENSLDRTVVVTVYGQPPGNPPGNAQGSTVVAPGSGNAAVMPSVDYDASDELEYGNDWWAWILRGVRPPPAYPPN